MTDPVPETDVVAYWLKNAYIPYNHLLPILVLKPGRYERAWLEKQVAKTYPPLPRQPTPVEQEVLDWHRRAKQALVREIATAGLQGTAPTRPWEERYMERIATWLCTLPVPLFRGMPAPKAIYRWSKNVNGGNTLDIVPADPRLGLEEIPDWSEVDPDQITEDPHRIDLE
jgi:hypothetical protein